MSKRKCQSDSNFVLNNNNNNTHKCVEHLSFLKEDIFRHGENLKFEKGGGDYLEDFQFCSKKARISLENIENDISKGNINNNVHGNDGDTGEILGLASIPAGELAANYGKGESDRKPVEKTDLFSRKRGGACEDELEASPCKNYQLRPRPCLRRPVYKRDYPQLDDDVSGGRNSPTVEEVFRRRRSRGSSGTGAGAGSRLSKYRRRTANARERHRMKEINAAFKTLREVLPRPSKMKDANLTKITTLRLAVDYIQALDDLLHNTEITLEPPSSTPSSVTGTPLAAITATPGANHLGTPACNQNSQNTISESIISNTLTDLFFSLTSSGSLIDSFSLDTSLGAQDPPKDAKAEGTSYPCILEDTFVGSLQNTPEGGQTSDPISLLLSVGLEDTSF